MIYTIKYYAGTYEGEKRIRAEDSEDAINQCRGWVRKQMTLSMYSDGYEVVKVEEEDE